MKLGAKKPWNQREEDARANGQVIVGSEEVSIRYADYAKQPARPVEARFQLYLAC